MKLNLKKPIIFFDLETTGVDFQSDRIVEISYIKVEPNQNRESRTIRVNPEMPIPASATAIHHITDEMVAECQTFKQIAKELQRTFTGCDIGGYNHVKFDLPLLMEEFLRAGISDFDISNARLIDVQTIYHKLSPRTLSAAYKQYIGKELEGAHGASADTEATLDVLEAMLDAHSDVLENDMDSLAKFARYNRNVDMGGSIVYDDNEVEVFNFGKYKGQPVIEVFKRDPSYYDWMMKGKFSSHTKQVIFKIYTKSKLAGK